MSRRARAVVFGIAALVCAGLAAVAAGSYGSSAEQRYGPLRSVLVTRAALPADRAIDRPALGRLFEVRRVPSGFAPPGALADPLQALGGRPAMALAPGSYVTQALFASPGHRRKPRGPLSRDRSPVELVVAGGAAVSAIASGGRARVDVVVTTEPGPGADGGRTYVAARHVPLLDVRRDRDPGAIAGEDGSIATLALKREQALELIRAESFARSIRLLAA
jgi:Flp pilus assembly protein CpaB